PPVERDGNRSEHRTSRRGGSERCLACMGLSRPSGVHLQRRHRARRYQRRRLRRGHGSTQWFQSIRLARCFPRQRMSSVISMATLITKEKLSMAHFRLGSTAPQVLSSALLISALAMSGAASAELPQPHQKDGRIGYVLTERHWSVYETEGAKAECPQGMNARGSRDLF